MAAPKSKLSNGREIPMIGLGTWAGWQAQSGQIRDAVKTAIDTGYRHIDTAYAYKVEDIVGAAVMDKIQDKTIKREDIFITSKLWQTFLAPEHVKPAFQKTLKDLGLEYLDLYLIHKPAPYKYVEGEMIPKDEDGNVLFDDSIDHADTWREMEKLVDEGLVKTIGISNFNHHQIQHLLDNCSIKPAVNQFEVHPYLTQTKLVEFCQKRDIHVTAFSPFGSPAEWENKPPDPPLLQNPKIKEIGERHQKTIAQVILRYLFQRGISVIPKSANAGRIRQNFQVFDFELTDQEMGDLKALNQNWRVYPHDWDAKSRHYPFNEVYD
ncbi:aldose reductase-related protein 2-like [Ptychodera flava]|uniref:aldose reductase-related protein 2-like n=1 Tax=Ptychodera flava TaxID=63121 RepID=UPI00396A19A2